MNVDLVNNVFEGNTAANYGGSLYFIQTARQIRQISISTVAAFNNSSTTLNTTTSHGGAIYLYAL